MSDIRELKDRVSETAGITLGLEAILWELIDHVAALERGAAECPDCVSETVVTKLPCDKHKPAPATVEKYTAYGFKKSQYCVSPTGADDQYQNHFARFVIGEVVATRDNNGWWRLCDEPNKWSCVYSQEQYDWLVDHNTKAGVWERQA